MGQFQAARVAVGLGLMLNGAAFASWVVRIPDAQHRLGLTEGTLGLDPPRYVGGWIPRLLRCRPP